ncbi:hypothetical protein C8R43DRAFT_167664 [Mycena crocata]|nr:hypothetical protein C8R43DRAFT_167664 [Mycena crocata]
MSTTAPSTTSSSSFSGPQFSGGFSRRPPGSTSTPNSQSRSNSRSFSGYQYYILGAFVAVLVAGTLIYARWQMRLRHDQRFVRRKKSGVSKKRPKLFDVYLLPAAEGKERERESRWEDLMPLAVFPLVQKEKNDTGPPQPHSQSPPKVVDTDSPSRSRAGVAVLIVMPNASVGFDPAVSAIPDAGDGEGDDIPHLDIGTLEELLDMAAFKEPVDDPDAVLEQT